MFVEHLADDLLDEVFEGDDTGGTAVFVDDDRHLVARERSSETRVSRWTVSGTRRGSVDSAATGTSPRFSRGTPMAALRWTTPTMSSIDSS